ncbi:acyltransferase family protein [Flavobacterium hibisci]|uniref:acyltransferase family protein n=1 Tax=Flavobacterium hibisci TaxID=1914462 RepID=UPI001CBF7E9A|nr:acyltransferase [Flavobacterium hibisci]MBZ4043520.1 acyltransferase [Flavobacterium hibisci]
MKSLPNLTSLRFILASLVVFFHTFQFSKNRGFTSYDNFSIFDKGEEAVFMFFSLSGFLIIRQLYIEKSIYNSINLQHFFLRRILRIFPLYYLILIFGLLYYRFILPWFGFNFQNNYNFLHGIFLSATLFSNIFASYKPGGIIEILWSIAIEEQFYLLIAPLIFVLPLKNIVRFLLFFTVLYFWLYFSDFVDFLKSYKMLFFYFSFSGMCSVILLNEKIRIQKIRYFVFITLVVYFTTSIFKDNLSNWAYHFFSMILFGLTICQLVEKPILILESKVLNHLGKISYGIYMYHAIMMQIVGLVFLKFDFHLKVSSFCSIIIFNFLVFTFTVLTANLSYRYFESYFLNLKKRLSK